jgi:hypothetical protein
MGVDNHHERARSDLNRRRRFCRPPPGHSVTCSRLPELDSNQHRTRSERIGLPVTPSGNGRVSRIRTDDSLLPKQALCHAELPPDGAGYWSRTSLLGLMRTLPKPLGPSGVVTPARLELATSAFAGLRSDPTELRNHEYPRQDSNPHFVHVRSVVPFRLGDGGMVDSDRVELSTPGMSPNVRNVKPLLCR